MIIHGDAAQLEWRALAYLSQDRVAIREILEGFDMHGDNQRNLKLPGWDRVHDKDDPEVKKGRLIAKVFLFADL